MPAGKFKLYQSAKEYLGDGTIDLDTSTFKIALFSSSSNANTLTNTVLANLTNQLTTANGYTSGGITLANVTWNRSAGTVTFDADNVEWTASGGSITARFAVIYQSGTVNGVTDALLCVSLLDTTPADVTAPNGNKFQINFNASGIFTSSGADVD